MLKNFLFWLYLNIIGAWKALQEQIWDRHRYVHENDMPRQQGKVFVITGGNRGIGWEAVKKLLPLGAHVILGVRRPEETKEKLKKLVEDEHMELNGGTYQVLHLDLMSLESVRKFARQVTDEQSVVHLLLNNAGIMFGPRKETCDNFESQLATNYLGHFLLTSLLMPKLREAGKKEDFARIVNVTSAAHFCGSWMDFEDLQMKNFYSPEAAYGNSKAAQVLFTKYLNDKLKGTDDCYVTVNCLHPGVVNTDLYQHANHIRYLAFMFMKSPEQGGDTLVHAAVSPQMEAKGGLYLENSHVATSSNFTNLLANQKMLWDKTCSLLNIQEFGKL